MGVSVDVIVFSSLIKEIYLLGWSEQLPWPGWHQLSLHTGQALHNSPGLGNLPKILQFFPLNSRWWKLNQIKDQIHCADPSMSFDLVFFNEKCHTESLLKYFARVSASLWKPSEQSDLKFQNSSPYLPHILHFCFPSICPLNVRGFHAPLDIICVGGTWISPLTGKQKRLVWLIPVQWRLKRHKRTSGWTYK